MPLLIKGFESYQTATVGELINELQKHPREMGVAFTYDGQITAVDIVQITRFEETDLVYGPVVLMNAET